MAYTGYTISTLRVVATNENDEQRLLGTIPFADKDSCTRFQLWWVGTDTKSKDVTRNGVKIADGVVTKGSTSDEQRMAALKHFGIELPTDEETVSFVIHELRYDTVDVFFGASRESRAKSLAAQVKSGGDMAALKADLDKLSTAERIEFFKNLAK